MIDERAAERFGRRRQAARRSEVGLARARIAARMVVREENSRAAVLDRLDDDAAQRQRDAVLVALVTREMEAPRVAVEMDDQHAFMRRVQLGKAAREELARSGEPVELQREFGTLMAHLPDVSNATLPNDTNRVGIGA